MPCTMPARGARQTPPHTGPAFDDKVANNPCGAKIVTSSGGVNVSSHALCLPHLAMKLGYAAIATPIVMEP